MSIDSQDDKRRFHRIFYKAMALLNSGTITYSCEVLDICLKGCLLRFDQDWHGELEALHTLTLQLSADVNIVMQLQVSHSAGLEVGFKCAHIDLESITQLRRLVELNLGDATLLERDILALSHSL